MIVITFSIYEADVRHKLATLSVQADQVRYPLIIKKMLDAGLIDVKSTMVKGLINLGSGLAQESLIYNVMTKKLLFQKRPWIEQLLGVNLNEKINEFAKKFGVKKVSIDDISMQKI